MLTRKQILHTALFFACLLIVAYQAAQGSVFDVVMLTFVTAALFVATQIHVNCFNEMRDHYIQARTDHLKTAREKKQTFDHLVETCKLLVDEIPAYVAPEHELEYWSVVAARAEMMIAQDIEVEDNAS